MIFDRQLDLIDNDKLELLPIIIVGGGSIGSYTTLALSKMGARNMRVIDFDKVEEHNIPNQFYKTGDVGLEKVEALRDNIFELTGTTIRTNVGKFEPDHIEFFGERGVVIVGTDNMDSRKQVYEAILGRKDQILRFIDARMAAFSVEIFNIDPSAEEDRKIYEEKLFPDEEGVDVPCTARGIIYPVMTCASIVCNAVRNIVMEKPHKRRCVLDYSQDFFAFSD